MQTRSRIPQIQQRAKEIIAELKKDKDVLDLVLDAFVPLPDGAESEPAKPVVTEVKTRAKRCAKCEELSTAPVHDPKSIGTSEFHEFVPRGRQSKRGIPASVVQSIAQDVQKVGGQDLDSPETCVRCPHPIDDNIHHKTTVEGYHEFKSAA